MADSNIKINITADDNASKKLKDLDTQAGKTEGGLGNLGKAAAVGGAALVAVGVKAVMAFEDLGLTVGKFADATGTTTEEASRLIEVSDDLGISSDTLQSSIGKMSKQLGANEEAFKSYGIEVQKNADGTTNVNETFLASVDAINAIEDPLKKAEASAKIFGKGYQGMAELLGKSSDEIRVDLAAVSDAKVFDDKKVKDARDMREAFDSIVDAGQDLLLTIGSALAPVITRLAPTLTKVVEAAGPLAEALGEVLAAALESIGPIIEGLLPLIQQVAKGLGLVATAIGALKPGGATAEIKTFGESLKELETKALAAGLSQDEFNKLIKEAGEEMVPTGDHAKDFASVVEILDGKVKTATTTTDELTSSFEHAGVASHDAAAKERDQADALAEHTYSAEDAKRATDNLKASWDALKGSLSDEQAWIDVQNSFDDVKTKGEEAFKAAAEGTDDAAQKARDYQSAMIDLKLKVIDYADEVGGLPPEVVSKIVADIDEGSITTADAALDALETARTVIYNAQVAGHREYASGTSSAQSGLAIVGEHGPELVAMQGGEKVYTASQTAAMLNGNGSSNGNGALNGATYNVAINVQSMPTPDDVMRLVKKFETRNGPGWRA